jgi:hypothetical protein
MDIVLPELNKNCYNHICQRDRGFVKVGLYLNLPITRIIVVTPFKIMNQIFKAFYVTISKAWNVNKECYNLARISHYNLSCFVLVCIYEEEDRK